MNAEQKQRAAELLAAWRATAYALHADRMADLLEELLTATNPAQISSLAEPQPPAPKLSDERILEIYAEVSGRPVTMGKNRIIDLARAVERELLGE